MEITALQEATINEFKEGLQIQISQYALWGACERLNVVYFCYEQDVYLKATVPDGISSDDAGMFVKSYYFRISPDGVQHYILNTWFNEKLVHATNFINCNPN